MDEEQRKLAEFFTEELCKFLKETPVIVRGMVGGYKAQFWLEPTGGDERAMSIKSNIISPEGKGMMLEELLKQ